MKYNSEYYKKIIYKNKYSYLKEYNKELGFAKKWLCSFNLDKFISGIKKNEKCLIIMGIGINGTPHLGTLYQIINAIYLQKKGYKVQIILGDLDVYSARLLDLKKINNLVKKYQKFIINLGFDIEKGILRTQYERDDILKTQYLISNKIENNDFYEIEEEINGIYKKEKVYNGMRFCVKQSIALMFADFIDPIIKNEYEHVLVTSGIDEHGYVKKANDILNRINKSGTISGLFTEILPGLNEYPKMCKSLKKSTIDLDMKKSDIKKIIMNEKLDFLVINLIEKVSFYSEAIINKIKEDYNNEKKEWNNNKLQYVDELYEICKKWRN